MSSTKKTSVIWQQAVHFKNCGGWAHDCQFMDQMGFPYLLSTGIGVPVDDAVSKVEIPQEGRYKLWVRCKDWYPSHSPGQFNVLVDDQASRTTFGKSKNSDWEWIDGGSFELTQGEVEVRLKDLTGWWSRCETIVLSCDPNFVPSNDLDALAKQRELFGAVSENVEETGSYDVVVVGGGLAGVTAAIAAARHNTKVALLQDRPVLGGNTSSEICVPALGDETRQPWDPRETGIIEEFDPAITGKSSWSTNLETVVSNEKNLDLFLNVRSTNLLLDETQQINSIEAMDTLTGKRYCFRGKIFIDCTGDGTIGYAAGADFRHGKESRAEYGESLAPEEASGRTMGNTLYGGRIEKLADPTAFETPAWAYQWKSPSDFEQRPTHGMWSTGDLPVHFNNLGKGNGRPPDSAMGPVGCWFAEVGGMYDTISDAEFIRDELFRICIGLWGYVKNYDPKFKQTNANRKLVELNYIAGKRESRRLLGDYVLAQKDYAEKIVHEDSIAYGGWTIDDHHPQGYFSPGPSAFHAYLQKVSIPYRCLYSRNVPNLMMAGRNISATHVAFGGTRVMRTCSLMGQAAGTAAAIAVREKTTPRAVYANHIQELQQTLLKDGAYLLGSKNQDKHDLAKTASVTASSSASGNEDSWLVTPISKWGIVHRVESPRAVMFKASGNRIEKVALKLRSKNENPTPIQLSLRHSNEFGKFTSTDDIALAEAVVPPLSNDWVELELNANTVCGEYYFFVLPKTEGLEWELYSHHPPETLRGFDGPDWGALWGCYKYRLTPGGEPPASEYAAQNANYLFEPCNVTNGFNRAIDGSPNSWSPDTALALPQHIELRFEEPVCFDTILISFQLALLAPLQYAITIEEGESWRTLLQVEKNKLRRRIHNFDTCKTTAVRLVLQEAPKNAASPLIPVCEIRLYKENSE